MWDNSYNRALDTMVGLLGPNSTSLILDYILIFTEIYVSKILVTVKIVLKSSGFLHGHSVLKSSPSCGKRVWVRVIKSAAVN
jgi:hypothetical protein